MKLKYDCMNILKDATAPWVQYKTGKATQSDIITDEKVQSIIYDALQKDEIILKRHNDPKHPMHKIALLADLGLTKECNEIKQIANIILNNQSENGAFLSLQNIPTNFGGTSTDKMDWVICDYPTLLYSLIKFGYKDDAGVVRAIDLLVSLCDDNGYRCYSSIEKFGGPGKKGDHCPYSNLLALRVFALLPEYHNKGFIQQSIDALLEQWRTRGTKKYRMFGIGTDFGKLKLPNVWFNIVHVLSVLSKYEYAVASPEFKEMLNIIMDKQQPDGGYIPESIYMIYKGWDFGQKKVVSETLTYQVYEIVQNINSFAQ